MIVGNILKESHIDSFSIDDKVLGKILKILINENKKAQPEEFNNFERNNDHSQNSTISDEKKKV